ncbi:MAG: phosphoribosylformylglycinamidine synthase subunit PurQ, partial [Proteobacteria bacterium]|nr:phosphoribosylformylglycinamidine synthase subunit PurQ [Pseudomonadota bacterium]
RGGAVFGICNGFQILVEAKILPGMLLKNENLKFICKMVSIKDSCDKILRMPIAHAEGRYFADEASLSYLEGNGLIAYRYCSEDGAPSKSSNPNGATRHIAGIYSKNRRVLGMMPHPERATDLLMGGTRDGLTVWEDFLERV